MGILCCGNLNAAPNTTHQYCQPKKQIRTRIYSSARPESGIRRGTMFAERGLKGHLQIFFQLLSWPQRDGLIQNVSLPPHK